MSIARNPSPPNSDTVLWRYLDDWKFEKFLEKFSEDEDWCEPSETKDHYCNDPGQLWFAYPRNFGDRFEGSLPDANDNPEEYCDRMAKLQGLSSEESARRKQRFLAADTAALKSCVLSMAQVCGVSCWHENGGESREMWEEFVVEKNGVAVRTTVGQLEQALAYAHNSPRKQAKPSVCAVGYVDHWAYFLPEDGFRNLLGIIQDSWSYESEVRFVAKSPALAKIPMIIKKALPEDPREWRGFIDGLKNESKEEYVKEVGDKCAAAYVDIRRTGSEGFNIPIKLEGLVSEIVLKSGCTSNYRATVKSQLQQAGLTGINISNSTL